MFNYHIEGDVAVIDLDDGKANAIGHEFADALNEGLDKALNDAKAVLLNGRPGVFSAGFDLKEFKKGREATANLLDKGARLLLRVFSHPQPVVIGCTGHAIAAGALLVLAADTRFGAVGDFQVGLNETAIGMDLPVFGLQLAAARLSPRYQTASVIQAEMYSPQKAIDAGFLDAVFAPEQLADACLTTAANLAELPGTAYASNKLALRAAYISTIESSLKG